MLLLIGLDLLADLQLVCGPYFTAVILFVASAMSALITNLFISGISRAGHWHITEVVLFTSAACSCRSAAGLWWVASQHLSYSQQRWQRPSSLCQSGSGLLYHASA